MAIKTQLETQQINNIDNKNLLEVIENFNVNITNADFEKSCDDLKIISNNITLSNICQRNLRAPDKSIVDECTNNQKEFSKKAF